jgi:hypothetical protein
LHPVIGIEAVPFLWSAKILIIYGTENRTPRNYSGQWIHEKLMPGKNIDLPTPQSNRLFHCRSQTASTKNFDQLPAGVFPFGELISTLLL